MPEIGEIKQGKEIGKGQGQYIYQACPDCGKERWTYLVKNEPVSVRCVRCCSSETRARMSVSAKKRRGAKNSHWKGGRQKSSDGYIRIKLQSDDFFYPMAHKDDYVYEHRLLMAKHLNRCLLSWEVVHHKNGIRDDNRLENFQLLSSSGKHASSTIWQQEIKKRDKRIEQLEKRVTLLEAELVALHTGIEI